MLRISLKQLSVAVAALIVLLGAPSSSAAQCNFDVSVYADGWVTENYLYIQFAATGYDNSPYCGCTHVSYGSMTVSGVFGDGHEFSQYFESWYEQDFNEGTYNYASDITIYCWCVMGPVYAGYAQGAVQAQSPTCGDERDTIIQAYRNRGVGLVPSCNQFTQSRSSQYFGFSEINDGNYSWALIRQPLIVGTWTGYGLDKWRENYDGPRNLNSGYRDPEKHFNLPQCAPNCAANSRHMYGDAGDLGNVSYTQAEWNAMVTAAENAFASYIEPLEGPCGLGCTHADWRYVAGGYY